MELKYTPSADMKDCPECGKRFFVLYPHMWAYKRRNQKQSSYHYFCSWKCLRASDKKKGEKDMGRFVLTEEQKRKAVQIAIDGGDPRQYLEELGSRDPVAMWNVIRQWIKGADPEMAGKLPKIIRHKGKMKTVETPEGEFTVPGKTKVMHAPETPEGGISAMIADEVSAWSEASKICRPMVYEGMTIREVEGQFGRYRYSRTGAGEFIDYENKDGMEVISYTTEQWRAFRKELDLAARIMGVEL